MIWHPVPNLGYFFNLAKIWATHLVHCHDPRQPRHVPQQDPQRVYIYRILIALSSMQLIFSGFFF